MTLCPETHGVANAVDEAKKVDPATTPRTRMNDPRERPDPDRGFRVEGLFVLPLEARAPWGQGTARACDSVVAGG